MEAGNAVLLCSAIVSGIRIIRTRNLLETIKFAEELTKLIYAKISKQGGEKIRKGIKGRVNDEAE